MRSKLVGLQVVLAGAVAGELALILVLRLNLDLASLDWWLWSSFLLWGAVAGGGAIGLGFWLAAWTALTLRRRPLVLPELLACVSLVAAGLAHHNAHVYRAFLTGSAHRILTQDAWAWSALALIGLALGALGRLLDRRLLAAAAILTLALGLPILRLGLTQQAAWTPPVAAGSSLGTPEQAMLVIAAPGLDEGALRRGFEAGRMPRIAELAATGALGPLRPHTPIDASMWASLACGADPRRHGVRANHRWSLPDRTIIGLEPWAPGGGAWLLPWPRRELAPQSPRIPPLWQRFQAGRAVVLGWPESTPEQAPGLPLVEARRILQAVAGPGLEPTLERDLHRLERGFAAWSENRNRDLWITLEGFLDLGPRARDSLRREQLLEVLDAALAAMLDRADDDTLVVLLSPTGVARGDAMLQLSTLVGMESLWRVTRAKAPDGFVLFAGPGVLAGARSEGAGLADIGPTIAYLSNLPQPSAMDGRVLREIVDPGLLALRPLRILD